MVEHFSRHPTALIELSRLEGLKTVVQHLSAEDRDVNLQVLTTLKLFLGPPPQPPQNTRRSSSRGSSLLLKLGPWLSNLIEGKSRSMPERDSSRLGMNDLQQQFVVPKLSLEEAQALVEDLDKQR